MNQLDELEALLRTGQQECILNAFQRIQSGDLEPKQKDVLLAIPGSRPLALPRGCCHEQFSAGS